MSLTGRRCDPSRFLCRLGPRAHGADPDRETGLRLSLADFENSAGVRERTPFPDGEMAEVALLLPAGQAAALEAAARRRGLTTAQLVRQIIRAFLDQFGEPRFPDWG
jgi:hypothetical protein